MLQPDNEHFRDFAGKLETQIARHGKVKNWNKHQKHQVETLLSLEGKFRRTLIRHQYGPWAYRRFIEYIVVERRNILAARPFFRERQEVFASEISKALKEGDWRRLADFSINYQFVLFVTKLQPRGKPWGEKSPVTKYAEQIRKLRFAIMEMNMPLGISRARVFYSRTPKSHLSYMDEIQIAAEGMMSGLDKYTPEGGVVDPRKFRATMINRISGDLIENYSETTLHFYPVDKRKIYRGHKAMRQHVGGIDPEKLADQVNEDADGVGLDDQHKTTPSEIADLMAASSCVSADSSLPTDPDAPEPITRFAAPESTRPDVQVESMDAMGLMQRAQEHLTVFERKLLRLKGVRFE